jgi:hypothetical protein
MHVKSGKAIDSTHTYTFFMKLLLENRIIKHVKSGKFSFENNYTYVVISS